MNLLVVFKELMSERNTTRAAGRLGVSQAAVSASLKRLRAIYNDPLFERTQSGLRPTAKAILLEPAIAQALAIIETTLDLDEAGEPSEAPESEVIVKIGLSDDFEMAFGPSITEAIVSRLPRARVIFRQTNSLAAAQALNDRDIDIAITSGAIADSRLRTHALGTSHYLVVYDRHRRTSVGPFELAEYVSGDHILVSFTGLSGITDDVLAEHGLRRRVKTATTHFSSLAFLLLDSYAMATIPSHAAYALCRLGPFAVSPTPLPFPTYAFGATWRYDTVRRPELRTAKDALIRAFHSDADTVVPGAINTGWRPVRSTPD